MKIESLTQGQKDTRKRLIDISYKEKLSHLGSCLGVVDIIDDIYKIKESSEKFILSCGHAHVAHAVVMEKYGIIQSAEDVINKFGIHCDRKAGCDVSTGSLGMGLPIAVGIALSNRERNVYCLISDGECAEGSIYEAFNVIRQDKLENLKIKVAFNGYGAYRKITRSDIDYLVNGMAEVIETDISYLPFLIGLDAHYKIINEDEYNQAIKMLK